MESILNPKSYLVITLCDYDWDDREHNDGLVADIEEWARSTGTAVAMYIKIRGDEYEITLGFAQAHDQTIWALTHSSELKNAAVVVTSRDL